MPYLINGVDLSTFATRITTAEGLQDGPDPAQGLVALFSDDGAYDPYAQAQMRPPDGPGSITFDMWLSGVTADGGLIPLTTTTADLYFRQWDALVRLFHRRRLIIDHVGPVGTRRCYARLTKGLAPSRNPSSPWFGRFKAECIIPAAYWFDLSGVTTGPQNVVNGGSVSLSVFSGSTGPVIDARVRFGPGNNPRLTGPTGGYVAWNGVIPSGLQVEFNATDGTIGPGVGLGWNPTYAPGTYAYGPGPRFFEIDPTEALSATLNHTGVGTVQVEVFGTRRYRTSGGG